MNKDLHQLYVDILVNLATVEITRETNSVYKTKFIEIGKQYPRFIVHEDIHNHGYLGSREDVKKYMEDKYGYYAG